MPILERFEQLTENERYKFIRAGDIFLIGSFNNRHKLLAHELPASGKVDDAGMVMRSKGDIYWFGESSDYKDTIDPSARQSTVSTAHTCFPGCNHINW